jgi:adenylate cyclase
MSSASPTRQLAAILFSDIAGYTAIMGVDEPKGIRLRGEHRALLRSLIPRFNGRVLEEVGDGTLASFNSAVDAVSAAREIQRSLQDRPDLRLRIGIHEGDVVFADDNVMGDAVNVASRIHADAPPGGIYFSERVNDEVRNKPDTPTIFIGEKQLKNVDRPIRVYALEGFGSPVPDAARVRSPGDRAPALIPRPTSLLRTRYPIALAILAVLIFGVLAVFDPGGWRDHLWQPASSAHIESLAILPLVNLSGDPNQDYFADGMTDELTTNLAEASNLRVTSRTSAMRFKGSGKPLPQIASELNVAAIVEGSVVRLGDRVRITAQLIEAKADRHLWAKTYERASRDVLALQDDVARDIADEISLKLSDQQRARLTATHRVDPEAYDAYLKGRVYWNMRTEEGLRRAQSYFERAIAKDPTFAPAYSGLADSFLYRGYLWGHLSPREAMPLAKGAALKSIQLNDNLAEGHTSLAMVKCFYDWDFEGAEREFQRAISINPNYATARHFHALNLAAMEQPEAAIAEARKAVEADPLSVPVNNILGEMLIDAHRYDEAIEQYRRTLELDPNTDYLHSNLYRCYSAKGLDNEAFEEWVQSFPELSPQSIEQLRIVFAAQGWVGIFKTVLPFLQASWDKGHWHIDAYHLASLHASLGDKDQAFAWLDKAIELRCGLVPWFFHIEHDPWEEFLRTDPRFNEFKRKTRTLPSPSN